MMFFTFNGHCKKCGNEIRFCVSIDAPEEYLYVVCCPFCGAQASEPDIERMYHLMDVFKTFNDRNSLIAVSTISQSTIP